MGYGMADGQARYNQYVVDSPVCPMAFMLIAARDSDHSCNASKRANTEGSIPTRDGRHEKPTPLFPLNGRPSKLHALQADVAVTSNVSPHCGPHS